jgi:predicted ester cyclase
MNSTRRQPLAVYRAWQAALASQDMDAMAQVVDLEAYHEICLGLTGWTTGYTVALSNYMKNMVAPWSDMDFKEEEVHEGEDTVTVRCSIEATHVGTFLGVAPTGRRLHWDHVAIVHVRDGRVVGQWAQPDLYGIYRQITSD